MTGTTLSCLLLLLLLLASSSPESLISIYLYSQNFIGKINFLLVYLLHCYIIVGGIKIVVWGRNRKVADGKNA